jgi:4-amino-4-deoxy-L-arabinose transferase-like glycosyltransferase
LAVDGNFITGFEPFYPVFLAVTRWVVGDHAWIVQLFPTLIASVGSVFLFRLAHLLAGSTRIAVTSALLYARAVIDQSGHLVVENARRRPFIEIASYFAFTVILLPRRQSFVGKTAGRYNHVPCA